MAGIYIKTDAPHYLKVYIGDLDPSWTTDFPQRTASWYITDSSNSGKGSFIGSQKLGASEGNTKYTSSEDEPFIFEDLLPYTEYKITCIITSSALADGTPGVNATLDENFWTLATPVINSFTITEPPTGRKYFGFSYGVSHIYYDVSKVMFEARQSGTSKWWRKATYLIEGETTDTEPIVTDEFGDYEFRMIVDTRGYQVVSDIVTATAVSYDYNYACSIVDISSERTPTSISVYLRNTEGAWYNLPERTASWYICTDGEFNVSRDCFQVIPDGEINTKNKAIVFDGLKPQTTYYIKCHITSEDSFDGIAGWNEEVYLTVSTRYPCSLTATTGHPNAQCIKWKCSVNEYYDEPLEYKLMVAFGDYSSSDLPEDEQMVQVEKGYIPAGGISEFRTVNVKRSGKLTVCLIVAIDGEEYRYYSKPIMAWPYPVTTTNFEVVTNSETLKITLNWTVDRVEEGNTEYKLNLYKRKDDGGSTLIDTWTAPCLISNTLIISAPEHGTYYIYISYLTSEYNMGNNYKSDDFTIHVSGRPWVWDWSATSQRQKAYSVIEDRTAMDVDEMDTFSYVVWDEFVDKVAEFMDYKGWLDMSLPNDMYGFTTADTYRVMLEGSKTGSNRALTVNMFNAVRYCIGSMNTFNVSVTPNSIKAHYEAKGTWDMQPKEIVYGAYFLDLAEWLNNVE